MPRGLLLLFFLVFSLKIFSQQVPADSNFAAKAWADSVYKTLSNDERIAQLMVVRLSSIDLKTKTVTFFDQLVEELVKKYNIGGICVFQGGPVKQAMIINSLQAMAKTPILMCMDAEWGVGQRLLDSVIPLPKQMMLGAMGYAGYIYQYGKIVAEQCKRFGIQVNYAPVVDVNNNPDNPVINDRSFGEDKYKVALFGTQYMKGMQDNGIMACAKHFPGHGDVAVDSHLELPVIHKTMEQLDSLELYPFRKIFNAGIASTMVAHLYIPSIDSTANRATSLSKNNVTALLRDKLNFSGLTFTDALEMQGVKKFFPDGEASVQSLIAGNDMLCLPGDVPIAIKKINDAITQNKLSREAIEMHCKKVLMAKYQYGLAKLKPIRLENLTADLNKDVPAMRRLAAVYATTLLSKKDSLFFPLARPEKKDSSGIAFVGIGLSSDNAFAERMRTDYNASVFYFDYSKKNPDSVSALLDKIITRYNKIVIGIHNINRPPLNNFGISQQAVEFTNALQQKSKAISFLFGNAYAAKNWCNARNFVVCYEDDSIVQNTAVDFLQGKSAYAGRLPVTVCENFPYGFGLTAFDKDLQESAVAKEGIDPVKISQLDSIASDAISKKAMPGCSLLVVKDDKIVYQKNFGFYTYENNESVSSSSVYDVASVTKICATTLAVMKLYEEGRLDLKKKLSDYLSWTKGSNKADLVIEKILLHEAGLTPSVSFNNGTLDVAGHPLKKFYSTIARDSFSIRVADHLFLKNDFSEGFNKKILSSPVSLHPKYVYSDLDFIFLGKIVEDITGTSLDKYVQAVFYDPMMLTSTGFKPREHFPLIQIVPTETETTFRSQLLRGDVHDPVAAMFGGVAGHAGLFSNAYDMACIMQMLLNGGTFNGKRYLQKKTIDLFTDYNSEISRRGFGFDKPEKDNVYRAEPYPAASASSFTFGHTGFTGTCVWADPASGIIFIFLSNRVYPNGSELLLKMNVRPKMLEAIYQSIKK